ncbi:hypothetical protein CHUAL_005364 [Chamberlinius hualienensis]
MQMSRTVFSFCAVLVVVVMVKYLQAAPTEYKVTRSSAKQRPNCKNFELSAAVRKIIKWPGTNLTGGTLNDCNIKYQRISINEVDAIPSFYHQAICPQIGARNCCGNSIERYQPLQGVFLYLVRNNGTNTIKMKKVVMGCVCAGTSRSSETSLYAQSPKGFDWKLLTDTESSNKLLADDYNKLENQHTKNIVKDNCAALVLHFVGTLT